MSMKMLVVLLLAAVSLTACGSNSPATSSPQNVSPPPTLSSTTSNDATTKAPAPYYGYEERTIEGQTWIVPDYINIEAFPPLGGKVTPRDARLLRLVRRPLRESEAGWYVNELRSRRTFEVIRLKAGEMIWASESGEVRYLDSCGNRISFLLAHHVTEIVNAPKPSPTTQQVDNRGWLLRRWDNYWYGPHWWYRTWVHVAPNGGTIKVTAGDITVDATGTGVADIAR